MSRSAQVRGAYYRHAVVGAAAARHLTEVFFTTRTNHMGKPYNPYNMANTEFVYHKSGQVLRAMIQAGCRANDSLLLLVARREG